MREPTRAQEPAAGEQMGLRYRRSLRFIAIPVLLAVGVAVYLVFARRANRAPTKIGPEGRWWGVKLLIAMAITVAVLVAVIAGYVQYVNGTH